MTNKKARLKPGDLVMVSYPMGEKWNNPAHKYDGETMVVRSVSNCSKSTNYSRKMYTLYGATSDAGMPYWFLADELIPI